jgi:Tfp pilus assembly protein PilO
MTIVVAVIITGLFAGLVYKDVSLIDDERSQIESRQAQIASAEAEIQRMPGREADVIVFREIVQRDAAILPDEAEINKFINVIGEFEKYSGVVVTQVTGLSNRDREKSKAAILKIPLKIELRGSIDQFLRFINLFENYDRFVIIKSFTISRGTTVDEEGVLQHQIGLELETYQYNPKGGPVARVDIPNYERRKQELAIQKRIRQSEPTHVEKYLLKPRISRRDPLDDPREEETADEQGSVDPEVRYQAERELLEELILNVAILQDDVKFEDKLREERDFMRIGAIARAIDQKIAELDVSISEALTMKKFTVPELRADFVAKVVQPYEEIKEKRKSRVTEVVVTRRQVHDWLRQVQEKFDAGAYADVIKAYEGYVRLTDGKKIGPDAVPLQEQIVVLARQAQVISRFEEENLDIDGTVIDPNRASFAIINGQILAEGSAVDADGKIRIHKIKCDQIEFMYQGVLIVKPLRAR